MRRYNNTAIRQYDTEADGNAYSNATVTVRDITTGAKSQIYSDNGATSLANPFNADAQGNYFFYVANGRYDIIINEDLPSEYTISDESIFEQAGKVGEAANIRLELIAHRGFRDSFPQNSMAAFTSAVRRGANSLECDVQFSADGVAYVFHDTTVNALTNGTGTFSSLTSAYINSLKFTETVGTFLDECSIPTFAQVLDYCKTAGLKFYPEIKGYRTSADIALFVDLIAQYEMQNNVVIQSFIFSDLEAVRSYTSGMAVGYLGSSVTTATYQDFIERLAVLGNAWLLWNYSSLLNVPAIKDYADSFGVQVGAWTVNDNWSAKRLMLQGIRHIMSDVQLEVI